MLSLSSHVVPGVVVTIPADLLGVGVEWRLEATYADGLSGSVSYVPRGGSGVGAGAPVVLIDLGAPIRREVSYQLVTDGAVTHLGRIMRPSPSETVLCSLDGRRMVRVSQTAAGDVRTVEPRGAWTDVPGRALSPGRVDPVAGAGGGQVTWRTSGAETGRMRELLASNAPVWCLHSCDLPNCDIPLVAMVWVSAVSSDRVSAGVAERDWDVSWRHAPDPEPSYRVPATTWAEFDERMSGLTWDDFDALFDGLSWAAFDTTDWVSLP